jgi:dihydroxyacetone kinase
MSEHPDDRPTAAEDASADMLEQLERLDEHIDAASKQAADMRTEGQPADDDDPVDDVAGGGSDHADHVDDPEESPLVGPE